MNFVLPNHIRLFYTTFFREGNLPPTTLSRAPQASVGLTPVLAEALSLGETALHTSRRLPRRSLAACCWAVLANVTPHSCTATSRFCNATFSSKHLPGCCSSLQAICCQDSSLFLVPHLKRQQSEILKTKLF